MFDDVDDVASNRSHSDVAENLDDPRSFPHIIARKSSSNPFNHIHTEHVITNSGNSTVNESLISEPLDDVASNRSYSDKAQPLDSVPPNPVSYFCLSACWYILLLAC